MLLKLYSGWITQEEFCAHLYNIITFNIILSRNVRIEIIVLLVLSIAHK